MTPSLPVLAFVGLFGLAGLGVGAAGLRSVRAGLRLRSADPDAVAEAAAGGRVLLEGRARPHEQTLESPLFGRDCLGYSYEVEQYSKDGDGDGGVWRTLDSGSVVAPFLLEDDQAVLVRESEGAGGETLDVGDDRRREVVPSGAEPPEQIRRFIERSDEVDSATSSIDLGIAEIDTGDRRRYTEHVLLPGERTVVSGVARPDSDPEVRVPREATAVVEPPAVEGPIDRVRHHLSALSFVVSDAPMEETARRFLVRGWVRLVVGGGLGTIVAVAATVA